MTPNKTAKLISKYPKIFHESFWFECNDGWFDIIDDLCSKIQTHVDVSGNQIAAAQVKQKFGALRVYIDPSDPETEVDALIYQMIREAEQASETTCESCGSPARIQSKNRWLQCLCDSCLDPSVGSPFQP